MEIEELKCLVCNESFNETLRIPRLLISCGHTYCHECLNILHIKGDLKSIVCPEDKTCYFMNNLEELPKNITLLKMITKKKNVSFQNIKHNTNALFQTPPNIQNTHSGPNFISSDISRNSLGKIDDKYESIRKKSSMRKSVNSHNDDVNTYNEPDRNIYLCTTHNRPLEVVCVDHRVKLCTNCALFGEHKSHDIRNEEDVFFELCTKAEILLETFEIIDFSMENYEKREQLDKIDFIFTEKFNLMLSKVDIYYKDFKKIIKAKRDKLIDLIKAKFESINSNIITFKKFPLYLEEEINIWRIKVKKKLDIIAEINDTNDIDYELLGKKAEEQQIDLISESEEFIRKIEMLKAKNTDEIESLIENYDVEWNRANIEFENFCLLTVKKNNDNIALICQNSENNVNENVLNFNDHADFDPRISIIPYNDKSITIKTFLKQPSSGKKSIRKLPDNVANFDKPGGKKSHPVINLFSKDNSQESISTKANETLNFKLDDSFYIKAGNSTVLNISEDILITNKNKANTQHKKGKLTNDKIVFIKNQFKNEIASFNCYDVGDDAAKVVAELILSKNCKVKDLKLTKTNISDEGSIQIFKAMEFNTSILNFNISKNLVTDKSFDSIYNCLKNNKIIKTVNLSLNLFSQSIKEKFKSAGKSNIKLTL